MEKFDGPCDDINGPCPIPINVKNLCCIKNSGSTDIVKPFKFNSILSVIIEIAAKKPKRYDPDI